MSKVNLKNSKPPPPHTRQLGLDYCKGTCHRYKSPKPNHGKDPYETHSYCRKCDGVWMKKEDTIKGLYCPCCKIRVANRSRKRKATGSKNKVYI